jgi:hypothetical protein
MTREEGESSVIVNIPNPLNKEVVVAIKNKDRDIIIDLNNNITLIRSVTKQLRFGCRLRGFS